MSSGCSEDGSQQLNQVIAEYLLALEGGIAPDRIKLLIEHPELAADLMAFFVDDDKMRAARCPRAAQSREAPSDGSTVGPGVPQEASTSRTIQSDLMRAAQASDTGQLAAAKDRRFGDYEIVEEIAHGGMGVVYKARQISLNRLVALKMILAGHLATEDDVSRFRAEAKAAANLDHPGIVPVYEVGELEGQHYYSMGFVEGTSLAARIADGPIDFTEAARLVKAIAEAVQYAHEHGVIHRDLKPANVLLKEYRNSDECSLNDGSSRKSQSTGSHRVPAGDVRPLITDFGLAKQVGGDSQLTVTGQVLGTPSYMPPEQATGRLSEVGVASDVYSLGAILYALLTGRPPFQAADRQNTLLQVVEREPVPPHVLNPRIDLDVETIALRCLQKDPRRRYASARELADELGRFLSGEPILARPIGASARLGRWCRRNPLVTALVSIVIASLVSGTVISSYFAVQAHYRALDAVQARDDATEKLWKSYLAQAQARRWSGKAGRRFESLDVLRKAAEIRPAMELRNEAIACMALPDLRVCKEWPVDPPTTFVTFDPDLRQYAQGEPDGSVSVRSVDGDQELLRLPGPGTALAWILRFSLDGQLLVAKYGKEDASRVKIWNLQEGTVAFDVPFRVSLGAIDFHPDGRRIALAELSGDVRIYDLSTWSESQHIASPIANPYAIVFDPSGARLAISANPSSRVVVVALESGQVEMSFAHPDGVRGIAWSPDASILATAAANGQVHLWNVSTGESVRVLTEHTNVVTKVKFTRTGDYVMSSAWGANGLLWNVYDRESLVRVGGEPLAFHRDDQFLTYKFAPYRTGIWEVALGHECRTIGPPAGKTPPSWVRAVISPNGRLLATSDRKVSQLWDLPTGKQLATLPLAAQTIVFHPDGSCFYSAGDQGLHRWPLQAERTSAGRQILVGPPHRLDPSHPMTDVEISRDGRMLSVVGQDRVYGLTLGADGQVESTLPMGRHARVQHVAIDPGGRWIVSATWGGAGVKIWDVRTGGLVQDLPVSGNAQLAFSPNGRWLATSSGKCCRLWQVGSWQKLLEIPRDAADPLPANMAFSPDSRVLAISSFGLHSRLIAAETGQELARLEFERQGVLCFSPEGTQLVVMAGGLIRVWDLRCIREQLARMNLDWEMPPYPPAEPHAEPMCPVEVLLPPEQD